MVLEDKMFELRAEEGGNMSISSSSLSSTVHDSPSPPQYCFGGLPVEIILIICKFIPLEKDLWSLIRAFPLLRPIVPRLIYRLNPKNGPQELLFWAAYHNIPSLIEEAIIEGAEINSGLPRNRRELWGDGPVWYLGTRMESYMVPLLVALRHGNITASKVLILLGADTNPKELVDVTNGLSETIRGGNLQLLLFMEGLENYDYNMPLPMMHCYPLQYAALKSTLEIIEYLLTRVKVQRQQIAAARIAAVIRGDPIIATKLLDSNLLSLNTKYPKDLSLFAAAVVSGKQAMIDMILQYGDVGINQLDDEDHPPIFRAFRTKLQIAKRLISMEEVIGSGIEIFSYACEARLSLNGLKELIEFEGFQTRLRNNNQSQNWLLHIAVMTNRIDAVDTIIEITKDINAVREDGLTALMVACRFGNRSSITQLLRAGADVNITTKDAGETALHIAARYATAFRIRKLMIHGARVNAKTKSGYTPLHYACSRDQTEEDSYGVIEELVKSDNADINALSCEGVDGKTALDLLLLLQDNQEVVKDKITWLIANGAKRRIELLDLEDKQLK